MLRSLTDPVWDRVWIRKALAFAAFLIFAATALTAQRPSSWEAEYEVSLPAAVSYAVYGTRLGLIESNVQKTFQEILQRESRTPASIRKAVETAARGDLPRGTPLRTIEGIGVGQPLFMSLAMKVFGPHLWALTLAFLCLMGLSTVAFVVRFADGRLFAAPLQFLALTVLMLGGVMADAYAGQLPIGGNRFFPIAGILPAIHIYLEFSDRARPPASRVLNFGLLAIQLGLLVFVILTRSAAAYLLAPTLIAAFLSWQRSRDDPVRRAALYRLIGNSLAFCIVFWSLVIASMPSYLTAGRVLGLVWHRAFISVGAHPGWPFGTARADFNCAPQIPEGLVPGIADRNGHCAWWAYPPNKVRDPGEVQANHFTPEYEGVMRGALLHVIYSYPWQAFQLYAYYKPLLLLRTLRDSLIPDFSRISATTLGLALLQLAAFAAFIACGVAAGLVLAGSVARIFGLLALFSLPPQWVAWAAPWTSVEVSFFTLALLALPVALLIEWALRQLPDHLSIFAPPASSSPPRRPS